MTYFFVATTLVLLVALVGVLCAYATRRGLSQRLRKNVVVYTTDSQTIRGVLTRNHADCIALEHAEFVHGDSATELAGEILVLRDKVSFLTVAAPGSSE